MKLRAQKGWGCYHNLWGNLMGWKLFFFYMFHYTLLFLIVSHFVFLDFIEAEKTFVWVSDGPTYFSRQVYLSQTLRDGIQNLFSGKGWTIPLYDFTFGPAKLTWGEDPLQLLAAFCPWNRIDILYDALVLLRYYLIGLSFSVFGFYFRQPNISILIGAISYTFCGFTFLAGVRHPTFMTPMILLPFLIIGTEKILKDEKPFLLIAVVFLSVLFSLYFSCMLAIIVLLYALIRTFTLRKEKKSLEIVGMLVRLTISGGIGTALGGVVLMPSLLQMVDTGRIGRDITTFVDLFRYSSAYYQKFFSGFVVEPGPTGSWTCLGFSVLAIPAIVLLFLRRSKQHKTLRIALLALTGMLLLPVVAYVMSGFNTISNRWCFVYAFCISTIIMVEVPYFSSINKQTLTLSLTITVGYIAICYFLIEDRYFYEGAIVFLILSTVLLCLFWFLEQWGYRWMLPICLLITCCSVCYSAYLKYDETQDNYISEFTKKDPYQYFEESQYGSFSQSSVADLDESFYRVAGSDVSSSSLSMSFYTKINGLTDYSSLQYPAYVQWLEELELPRKGMNIRIYGLRTRSNMLTLANVKYYILREGKGMIAPFGFQEIERIENNGEIDIVMENQFALPIGYTYDTYLLHSDYMQYSPLARQCAQIQTLILDESPSVSGVLQGAAISEACQIPVSIAESKGLSWKDGILKVKEEKATLTLEFVGLPQTETYLRIVNLDLTKGSSTRHWTLNVTTGGTRTSATFAADAYLYSHGVKTQLLDLGYSENGFTTCTITFPSKGTFKLEDLEIWCEPMDNYGAYIDALREEVLENVETNWRGLTGTISVSKDKMLCIAIPYDEGWTAYVDGEKAKLYQANTAFMAVELSSGNHEIELRYWTPGLTAGIVLSGLGISGLIVLVCCSKKRERKFS